MEQKQTGIITIGIGGFYTIACADGQLIQCKPKGLFRKQGIKPLAGDNVKLSQEAGSWFIDEILPRRNVFVRPPVANVNQFIIVVSTVEPSPSFLVIDKLLALAEESEVSPILVVTKNDLSEDVKLEDVYKKCAYPVFMLPSLVSDLQRLRQLLPGKLSVLCGNSGVGKTTLLNALLPGQERETGEISQKLGRGRHTTRAVELLAVEDGWLADTPGFASLDLARVAPIFKENLQYDFIDVAKHAGNCRFTGCTHLVEAGCAVRDALEKQEIAPSRYESYCTMYTQAKQNEKY